MLQARSVPATFVMLLLLAPAAVAVAQQAGSPQQTSPDSTGATLTLKITSRLTLVDVTATDSKGKPVHGLTQPEFTVKEDGKPQPIKSFEEHGTEKSAAQTAAPPLPPNIYTNAEPLAPTTGALNVLMFDDVATGLAKSLPAGDRMYARQQAIKYLRTMPAGTRIAVLELGDSLHVVQNFTSDRAVLLAVVNALSPSAAHGGFSISSPPASLSEACGQLNTQSELTVDGLEAVAAFLSGVEGRKDLIWFTQGIPWLTSYPEYARVPCLRDYTPELQRAYGLLTAARVALYPVDPRGLPTNSAFDASAAPRSVQATVAAVLTFGQDITADDHSLREMANATGGVPYFNRNDLDGAVGEAIATGADYYSLSYVPPLSKYDGQYHRIDVKVDRPGVHLQYRDGYTAIDLAKPPKEAKNSVDKTAAQPDDELHTFMGHGVAPSTQLIFAVRVTPSTTPAKPGSPSMMGQPNPALKGKPLVRYDFQYALDPSQITLESDANGKRMASIEFVLAAYDGAGKMLNVMTEKVSFAVKTDRLAQFLQGPLKLHPVQFDLPPGNIFVRVVVRDLPSDKIGTLEVPVSVDKPKK